MALHRIKKVIAFASAPTGKLQIRVGSKYRLADENGNELQVTVLGIQSGEMVIAPVGRKKSSDLIAAGRKLDLIKKALFAAGVYNFFAKK